MKTHLSRAHGQAVGIGRREEFEETIMRQSNYHQMKLLLQSPGEETGPTPHEENPGALLCVDTNVTSERVPLSVHLNPGGLTNGELRLEGPPASAVRVWNHFTETNAANIVTFMINRRLHLFFSALLGAAMSAWAGDSTTPASSNAPPAAVIKKYPWQELQQHDLDQNGVLDEDEEMARNHAAFHRHARWLWDYDLNKNGRLEPKERALALRGQRLEQRREHEKQYDANHDGRLRGEESKAYQADLKKTQ